MPAPDPADSTTEELLAEIRDEIRALRGEVRAASAGRPHHEPPDDDDVTQVDGR